jgi:hypothetical protein
MSTSQRPPDEWRPLSDTSRVAVASVPAPAPQSGPQHDSEPNRANRRPASLPEEPSLRGAHPERRPARRASTAGGLAPRSREVRRGRPAGLSAPAAAALCAAPTLAGGLLDAVIFGHLSWLFGIGFVVGAIWQAGRLRVSDLVYAGIIPPLVFAGSALVVQQFLPAGNSGNRVVREALDLASSLASSAPVLFAGTLLACALGVLRWRRERQIRARRRARQLARH